MVHEHCQRNAADIRSPQQNLPFPDIPESGKEIRYGGFSAAGGPHQGGHAVLGHGEGYIIQDLPLPVAEAHVPEFDLRAGVGGADLHCPRVRQLRLGKDRFDVVQAGIHHREPCHRIVKGLQRGKQLEKEKQHADEIGQGHGPLLIQQPAQDQHHHRAQGVGDMDLPCPGGVVLFKTKVLFAVSGEALWISPPADCRS